MELTGTKELLNKKKVVEEQVIEESTGSSESLLVKQVSKEIENSIFYQTAQNWCDNNGFLNASKFYTNQSLDEKEHSNLFLFYLQGNALDFSGYNIENKNYTFSSLVDVIKQSLEKETMTTKSISNIMKQALKEDNHLLQSFITKMLKKQIAELKECNDLLAISKGLKEDDKLDMLHLDEYFK